MKDIEYKQYTPEENAIYYDSIEKILTSLRGGSTFEEACSNIDISDASLKSFIFDDAIKVMIAELHYRDGFSLLQVAERLNVPVMKISCASLEMLEDVTIASSEAFKKDNPDVCKSFDA